MTESLWQARDLAGSPHRVRPETHWLRETTAQGREDGGLWFSLQLSRDRAQQLYDRSGPFAGLFDPAIGVRMAPTSRTALKLVLDGGNSDTIGTDIFVPEEAFATLEALPKDGIEITDAGLAVDGEIGDEPRLHTNEGAKSNPDPGPIPRGSPVIIAIIDDGIGIANDRFRVTNGTETRVKHYLDLALVGTPATGAGMVDELLGRSCKGSDIDKLLGRDEEQIYRALGLIDPLGSIRQPLRGAVTHGTHMLDIAAGYDWRTEENEAAKRPIIAVQVPTQVSENRSDAWLPQSLKRALDWILIKADELSDQMPGDLVDGKKRRLPLVVNGSFASLAGPQDGQSDVERRISQFVKTYRGGGPEALCTVVLAAGNSLQLRAAAQLDIPRGSVGEIPWRVQPDDKTPNFVEVWLPNAQNPHGQQAEVSLVPPRDAPAVALPSQLDKAVEWIFGGHTGARLYHQRLSRNHGGSRECITIAIRATADDRIMEPVVPAGLWRIKVENKSNQPLSVDLRVHRDDVGLFSRSGARQSYLDHPDYQMFDPGSGRIINGLGSGKSPVQRRGTLNTYGYAEGTLVVTGYRRSDGEPAAYSSASGRGTHRMKGPRGTLSDEPDLAAVSEESPSLGGVLAAGTYSGSVAVLNGTSVATPQATRALANEIAEGGSVNTLKQKVTDFETGPRGPRKGWDPVAKHPLRLGVGRLSITRVPGYRRRSDDFDRL